MLVLSAALKRQTGKWSHTDRTHNSRHAHFMSPKPAYKVQDRIPVNTVLYFTAKFTTTAESISVGFLVSLVLPRSLLLLGLTNHLSAALSRELPCVGRKVVGVKMSRTDAAFLPESQSAVVSAL